MQEILDIVIFEFNDLHLTIGSILLIILGYIITRTLVYIFSKTLRSFFVRRKIDVGRSYAVIQFVKYLAFLFFFLFALNVIGIKLNYILTGSAALLVGVGIGLQSTFNDFFSGLILLFEGTVEVGDQLMFNNVIGSVKHIGLRTSKIETRDKHIIIIPNSHLVTNEVINLSHLASPVRFNIDVGVSYESDLDQVEKVILKVMKDFPPSSKSLKYIPQVNLHEYSDSAVIMRIYFFSEEVMVMEKIKSDIRKKIFKAFRKEGIHIPFPQRDLWLKNPEDFERKVEGTDKL